MQNVSAVLLDKEPASPEVRVERLTRGTRSGPSMGSSREKSPRLLLDTRFVRAELSRLRERRTVSALSTAGRRGA